MPSYEDRNKMSEESLDLERARQSMIEEFQAIDWYQERIDATKDSDLKKILEHNKNEEKEHAAMLFEYIKKKDLKQFEATKSHD